MYYRERSLDPDWLVLLGAAALLLISVMYNPPRPRLLASNVPEVLVLGAELAGSGTQIIFYAQEPHDVVIPELNRTVHLLPGVSQVSIPLRSNVVRVCVDSNRSDSCGVIYPILP